MEYSTQKQFHQLVDSIIIGYEGGILKLKRLGIGVVYWVGKSLCLSVHSTKLVNLKKSSPDTDNGAGLTHY